MLKRFAQYIHRESRLDYPENFRCRKIYLFGLSLLSGLMLGFSFPDKNMSPILFIALSPLLFIEDYIFRKSSARDNESTGVALQKFRRFSVFFYAFVTFFTWNIFSGYWVWYSSPASSLAILFNALLMALVFHLYHFTRKRLWVYGKREAKSYHVFLLVFYWIAFEYFHFNWDLSLPWLTLGNGFANVPQWIQWYEYTGVLGGTLWIWLCNIFFFRWMKSMLNREVKLMRNLRAWVFCFLILLPVIASMLRYRSYKFKGDPVEVVVVQPNIDPYTEQYEIQPLEAVDRMLNLAAFKCTERTRFLLTPESMIQEYVWEDQMQHSPSILAIRDFLKDYPQMEVVAGISSYTHLSPQDSNMPGSRKLNFGLGSSEFYLAHNSVILIDTAGCQGVYHKSKLTPGVEIMPFVSHFKFLEKLALDLGGTVGTLGIDKERKVFSYADPKYNFSSVICYESVYGDFVAANVRKGAQLLFISTNDGWWKKSPGHRQHAAYARLRAIETRRDIARSANTGISCFINQRGDVYERTSYDMPAVIAATLRANDEITFYTRYGDMIGRVCLPLSLLFLLLALVYGYLPLRARRGEV